MMHGSTKLKFCSSLFDMLTNSIHIVPGYESMIHSYHNVQLKNYFWNRKLHNFDHCNRNLRAGRLGHWDWISESGGIQNDYGICDVPIKQTSWSRFLGIKWPGREAENAPSRSAESNAMNYTSSPQISSCCCLIKNRYITFTFR